MIDLSEDYETLYYHLQVYPEIKAYLDAERGMYEMDGGDGKAFRDGFLQCFLMRHDIKSDQEEIFDAVHTIATSTKGAEVTAAMKRIKEIHKNQPFKKYYNI
jgi:hypothetical protein